VLKPLYEASKYLVLLKDVVSDDLYADQARKIEERGFKSPSQLFTEAREKRMKVLIQDRRAHLAGTV